MDIEPRTHLDILHAASSKPSEEITERFSVVFGVYDFLIKHCWRYIKGIRFGKKSKRMSS